jgi:hypothetical protein
MCRSRWTSAKRSSTNGQSYGSRLDEQQRLVASEQYFAQPLDCKIVNSLRVESPNEQRFL